MEESAEHVGARMRHVLDSFECCVRHLLLYTNVSTSTPFLRLKKKPFVSAKQLVLTPLPLFSYVGFRFTFFIFF